MKHIGTIALFIIGTSFSFYGGFAMLGGPDGDILSKSSLQLGIPALLFAAILLYWVKKLSNSKYIYAYAPLAVAIIAWLVALLVTQTTGFYFWLYGIPASFIAAVIMHVAGLGLISNRGSNVE